MHDLASGASAPAFPEIFEVFMSSAVISTSAALRRPFLFEADAEPDVYCHPERSGTCVKRISRGVEGSLDDPRLASVLPASQLAIRPASEMASSGIPELDALTGGLPRGCLTEICGAASSGRTTVLLATLAAATRRGEFCAVIDANDSLDPQSMAAAGVDLDRLLWVRCGEEIASKSKSPEGGCPTPRPFRRVEIFSQKDSTIAGSKEISSRESEHRLEQVLRATDLLLESGGFGLIILDLADVPPQSARRIPLTTWFRFRRAVEHKATILLAIEQQPIAGSCSSLLLKLEPAPKNNHVVDIEPSAAKRRQSAAHAASRGFGNEKDQAPEGRKKNYSNTPTGTELSHINLFTGLEIHAELIRSRMDRKPAHSIAFETKTAWAG